MKRSPNSFEDYFEHLLKNVMLETIKRALRQLILNLLQRENTENSRELCIRGALEERAINGGGKKALVIASKLDATSTKLMKKNEIQIKVIITKLKW